MGFSLIVVATILLTAGLFVLTQTTGAFLNAQKKVLEGVNDAQSRLERAAQGALRVDDVVFEASGTPRAVITAFNDGAVTYNASLVNVLLDGVVRDANVTSVLVEGAETLVWPPKTTLVLEVANPQLPAHVALAAPDGKMAFWRE
ncbi:MAG TPA: hypothetical protein VM681_08545 [Candidatus Thermoplasmatota archaeon]|nr:hypothetical protein [Candidatus Thermoplasmatota archaeon]